MDGLIINKAEKTDPKQLTTLPVLLAKCGRFEIMRQNILANAVMWVTPADNPEIMEFFCVLKGAIKLILDNEEVFLTEGDSFYVSDLKEEVFLRAEQASELIYITNGAYFNMLNDFQGDLQKLLLDINDKDHITFAHSRKVQKYSIRLFQSLPGRGSIDADEMVIAALFHDVGKCFIPDEILKKKGSLAPEEWRHIIKHPHYSARLLMPRFGSKVAEIAKNHHERLDGSGYPYGLKEDEISFEAKIVAVADVFDAMTSDRGYNKIWTYEAAATEIFSLKKKFDPLISSTLLELVKEGSFMKGVAEELSEPEDLPLT